MDEDAHRAAKAAAAIEGKSLNRYILDAIDEKNAEYKILITMSKHRRQKEKKMR